MCSFPRVEAQVKRWRARWSAVHGPRRTPLVRINYGIPAGRWFQLASTEKPLASTENALPRYGISKCSFEVEGPRRVPPCPERVEDHDAIYILVHARLAFRSPPPIRIFATIVPHTPP
jgi:hypothetical protein